MSSFFAGLSVCWICFVYVVDVGECFLCVVDMVISSSVRVKIKRNVYFLDGYEKRKNVKKILF